MVFGLGKTSARIASYVALFAAAGAIPVSVGALAEASLAQDVEGSVAATLQPAVLNSVPSEATLAPADDSSSPAVDIAARELDPELICMAKVVAHEAGGEPHDGQLAVAQLLLKRMQSGRFPTSVCGVANQHGQFFNTAAYNPPHESARWQSAVAVAIEAMDGKSPEVAPGAMFFRSAVQAPSSFFRTRTRIATIGHQVFYR